MDVITRTYPNNVRPKYLANTGRQTVLAAAHTAATAFFWLINPVDSTKRVAIKRIVFRPSSTSALVAVTAPLITIERMSVTAAIVGSSPIWSCKLESIEPTPSATISTWAFANVIPGATALGFIVPAQMTAVGVAPVSEQSFIPAAGEEIILVPGEGVVCRQATAATASDTRVFTIDLVWEEY